MSQNPDLAMPLDTPLNLTTCSNCHSAMPAELRFCRNCGFRLGEGLAEYTETVRFDNTHRQVVSSTSAIPSAPAKKRKRISGMAWIFIAMLVFFIGAAGFTALVAPMRSGPRVIAIPKTKSFVGVNGFEDAENQEGATFDFTDIPGGPADLAGLVGGDIITMFDGQQIHDEDQINDLMEKTPIGKTVDLEYLRDGVKKTTKITTISRDENRRLNALYEKRPEGKAQFGYEDGDAKRVPVPGTNIYGVQLNDILPSRPADLAGIKEGDIVIEFDGIPIRTRQEFLMRVKRALPYSTVKVVVMRGDEDAGPLEKIEIPVKMGRQ